MSTSPDLTIIDTAIDSTRPGQNVVVYRDEGSARYYKVCIRLTGRYLAMVEKVTYELHPSFEQPVREVYRTVANPDCSLTIWTWGTFPVSAEVLDKFKNRYQLSHTLAYDDAFTDTSLIYEVERIKLVARSRSSSPRL